MNNNIILNRFFSEATFSTVLQAEKDNVFARCIDSYVKKDEIENNEELIKALYQYLQENYRNEYFYKNTLFNKEIIGRHSLNTTTALTEVPIHKSKADFIKINGSAVVYEIKTDLDSFERLEQQLLDYYKAFPIVNLVISEKNEEKARRFLEDTNVGIIVLTKRNQFSKRKQAKEDNSYLDMKVMFNILRKSEFEKIIKNYYGFLPEAKPVFFYRECFKFFNKIPLDIAHQLFIAELKKRNQIDVNAYLNTVPYELRFLAYFSSAIQKNYENLVHFLKSNRRN